MTTQARESQFKIVYEEYKNLVFNLSLQYVQQAEDAQDITQEVFLKIFRHLENYDSNVSSMKTWIYRISINHSLDFLKSKKRKKRFGFITSLFSNDDEGVSGMADFDHPGIAMEDRDELKQLFGAINRLPEKQRTALILSRIEEKSQKEVAEIMNLGVKAVESLLQRAKNNLQKMFEGREGLGE